MSLLFLQRLVIKLLKGLGYYLPIFIILFSLLNCDGKKNDSLASMIGVLGLGRSLTEPPPTVEDPPVTVGDGGTAGPGEPTNPPVLNDLIINTANTPQIDDPYGIMANFFLKNVTFQQPVHNQTVITAFIGRRNMALESDGSVSHSFEHFTLKPSGTGTIQVVGSHFAQRSDTKLKVLVVAKNEFGTSSKEANVAHARFCAGVALAPTTIGDCNDYCVQGSLAGNTMELKAKYNLAQQSDYLYLDISSSSPLGTGLPISSLQFVEFGAEDPPIFPAAGQYEVTSTFNTSTDTDYMCVEVDSFVLAGDDIRILQGKIRNE